MNRFWIVPLACVAIGLAAVGSLAQVSATQPSDQPRIRFGQMDGDEQKAVTDWMKAKMPNLATLIASLPDTGRPFKRNRLLNAAAARYRTYQQAKDSPQSLEAVMRSVRLEDEIFGYVDQLDDAPADKRVKLQEQIRTKTRALVELFLSDRAERIARLRARLDAEQSTLDADRAHANLLVDQRLAHFMIESTTRPADEADSSPAQP